MRNNGHCNCPSSRFFFPAFLIFTQNSCATTQINFEKRPAPPFSPIIPNIQPKKKPSTSNITTSQAPPRSKALGCVLQHGQHAHCGGRAAQRWGLWGRRARELGAMPSGQRALQHAAPRWLQRDDGMSDGCQEKEPHVFPIGKKPLMVFNGNLTMVSDFEWWIGNVGFDDLGFAVHRCEIPEVSQN